MPEQRRIGYHWNLRKVMATRNLWKTTELQPLLRLLGASQIQRESASIQLRSRLAPENPEE